MSEADIRSERLKKLDLLKAAGMEAYPVTVSKDYSISEVLARFEVLEHDAAIITIVGRIMARRGQGGIIFADVFDGSNSLTAGGTGRMQVVLQKDDMDATFFELFNDVVDIGDFIQVTGIPFTTKRGERSIKVSAWTMAAKSLLPIPDEWFGLKDEEKILRERYLDILLNPEVRAMFERRFQFWNSIRQFLIERGFIEVETPILESSPGGADARPFVTHHNALDIDVYLRISAGELWQKMLLVAGFPKVFEIGRIFRNEGQSREHAQDYTQLEFYQAFSDYREGMKLIQEMYRHIAMKVYGKYTFDINDHTVDLADEWTVIDYSTVIKEKFGIDPLVCSESEAINVAIASKVLPKGEDANKARAIDLLWKQVRKTITGPAFLIGVPIFLEPLAKRSPENENVVERFQVIIAGSEMGKGFSELNDPIDQRSRFEAQQAMRDAGDDEAQRLDEGYIRAMEYGMPPAFGFGVSERLFSFLEDKPISEGQLFPLLRPKE
jgi:lysyl-tRNA synthetase class 2